MSKARDLADFISTGSILSDGTIESTEINGVTADASELNVLDGITVTTGELNNVAGINSSVQTQLDGKQAVVANVSSTEIGYLDGVTSSLQTQLDNISVTSGSLTKSFTSGETASITLGAAINPAPVVSVTKEIPQVGVSSKGTWDVNATASNYELHNTAYSTTLTASSVGYQISSASYDNKSFDTTKNSNDLAFKDDGTKVSYVGNNNYIWQRTLSTAWDISTAGAATSFDQSSQDIDPRDVTFKTDGTKMYLNGDSNNRVFQYSLSTAWDITTATYDNKSHLTTNQTSSPYSTEFKSDGTKMYITGGGAMYEYSLSTAWDVSTATYTSNSFTFTSQDTIMRGIFLKPDGTKLYAVGNDNDSVFEYTFGTAWDLSTLSYSGTSYALPNGTNPTGIAFSTDGTKLYNTDFSTALIYQYSTGSLALVLGTGSFASTDVGKRIQGNGGDVTLTSTAGAYDTTGGSAFTDSSTIASGSWSMRGLKSAGDADGITIPSFLSNSYDVAGSSSTADATYVPSGPSGHKGFTWKSDGTKFYVVGDNNSEVYEFPVTTPYDISTASSSTAVTTVVSAQTSQSNGVIFNNSGTQFAIADNQNNRVVVFTMSTAWDITTASQTWNSAGGYGTPTAMLLASNGSVLWVANEGNGTFYKHPLSTANDFTTMSYDSGTVVDVGQYGPAGIWGAAFNGDGTKVFIVDDSADKIWSFDLSTAYDFTTIQSPTTVKTLSAVAWRSINFSADGTKMHIMRESGTTIEQYDVGSFLAPTAQYHIAATNSGGQIDTAFWTDLNTMVADQAAGDGTVHYAVSTDDRTTWSIIKEGSGVRPIVRDNSGTWQYNSDAGSVVGGTLESPSFVQSYYINNQPGTPHAVAFSSDGTQMYVGGYTPTRIYQYTLSTAWNIGTASYSNKNYDHSGESSGAYGLSFKPDGTKMYIMDGDENIDQYTLSTAWDVSTASYDSKTISMNGVDTFGGGITFKPDGTLLYFAGGQNDSVYALTLSTAWDISTLNTSSYTTFSTSSSNTTAQDIVLNSDGTRLFTIDSTNVYQYNLSTAYDLSTATYSNLNFSLSSQATSHRGMYISSDNTKLFTASAVGYVYEYSITGYGYGTSTTWANSTTNNEFYALQQALGATAVNRMDKTQLDAVTDPNHFTLGDTLDLAIALRMDTASASTPTADGVTINYDAASLNQGAVLGTDYDYDFPDSTTVRVTSNAAQNLKIRVV